MHLFFVRSQPHFKKPAGNGVKHCLKYGDHGRAEMGFFGVALPELAWATCPN
jgi:hypothetical protein